MEVVITRAWGAETALPARALKATTGKSDPEKQPLFVTVLFTSIEATLAALHEAHRLASDLCTEICILMPQVVPCALPLDRPAVDPAFRVRRLCESIFGCSCAMHIEVHLCRDLESAVTSALRPGSLVVIGCRKRWRLGGERALARSLRRAGHEVVLIPEE